MEAPGKPRFSPDHDAITAELGAAENCFLVSYSSPSIIPGQHSEDLQVRGYDVGGALIYQSPIPENWAKVGIYVTE